MVNMIVVRICAERIMNGGLNSFNVIPTRAIQLKHGLRIIGLRNHTYFTFCVFYIPIG